MRICDSDFDGSLGVMVLKAEELSRISGESETVCAMLAEMCAGAMRLFQEAEEIDGLLWSHRRPNAGDVYALLRRRIALRCPQNAQKQA
jgi:hypothetical protein